MIPFLAIGAVTALVALLGKHAPAKAVSSGSAAAATSASPAAVSLGSATHVSVSVPYEMSYQAPSFYHRAVQAREYLGVQRPAPAQLIAPGVTYAAPQIAAARAQAQRIVAAKVGSPYAGRFRMSVL